MTARRRAEPLQTVPLAVTAITSTDFARQDYQDLRDLNFTVPNISIFQAVGTPGSMQVYIRGVGTDDFAYTSEQGVGLYLDGVIINKQQGAMLDLIDVDSIEVLRGPQGTLYGRNSTGGAVKFTSKRPDLNDVRFLGQLTAGRYGRFDQAGSISVPLIKGVLAVRLTAQNRQSDGYMRDVANGNIYNETNRQGYRLSVLAQPNDALSIYVAGDLTVDNSGIQVPTPLRATTATGKYIHDGYGPLYDDPYVGSTSLPDINKLRSGGLVADIAYDFGGVTAKSITGYRALSQDWAFEGDGTAAPSIDLLTWQDQEQFSEELQLLSSGDGPFKYTLGLFYFHEVIKVDSDVIFQGTRNYGRQVTESYAAYFDGTYNITPLLRLTAGLRYTRDKKDIRSVGWSRVSGAQLFDVTVPAKFGSWTPRGGIDWQVMPDVMLYASASRGYKAGGYVSGRPSDVSQAVGVYSPETVWTYEAGFKSQLFGRRVRFNVNYFHNDYKNFQLTYRQSGQLFVTTADARMDGIEAEALARVTRYLTLRGTFGYTGGKYTFIPRNPGTGVFVGGLFPEAKLKEVPPIAFSMGAGYDLPISGIGTLGFNIDYTNAGRIYHNGANSLPVSTPPTATVDGQISLRSEDERWTLSGGARNFTNEPIQNSGNAPATSRFYEPETAWYVSLKVNL